METRRRKRAEATSSAPSSSSSPSSPAGPTTRSSKLARLSTGISATTVTPAVNNHTSNNNSSSIITRSRVNTRSNKDLLGSSSSTAMDTTNNESSGSGSRGRRGRGSNKDNKDNNSDKGKEKEHEVRIREREREREIDAERSFGLNIDSGDGEDDENDSEGGVGILHQNLTSASSALQGLLRKLGAGLDDLLPSSAMGSGSSSHQSGRLKKILSGLRADGEEGKQVEALTQLCELLSIGTEESLSTFSVDSFVPILVSLLNHESNADIMLLAARALTHLVDVLPSSSASVVHYGAVSCFVARLLTIEYMDLAEQSLQALRKISHEHPTACLRAGALMAVLSYLDFFSTGVQRVALSTAANMCKKLPSDAADFVMEAVPLLTNLLQYHDSKVLEHASVCLTRIAEAFASSPDKLDELCNLGLVTQAASLISIRNSGGFQSSLSPSTYTGLIRLLTTCVSGSHLGAKSLLLSGISGDLKEILSGSGLVAGMSVSPALSRPADQIFEIVNLANELLPALPQGTISLPANANLFVKSSIPKKSPGSSASKQESSNGDQQEVSAREKLLMEHPELLQQFGMDLLPVLIQIYGSSVNSPVRHKCLSVIGKLMYFSPTDMIQSFMSASNISSFLAGVLAWKDPQVLVPALQISEILMEKLPETFSKMFVREGVVHAIDTLIMSGSPVISATQPSSSDKDNDSIPGSSRSRRNRRRGLNTYAEAISTEEAKRIVSNTGTPPSSTPTPSANSSLRATVSASAKAFKEKHFPSNPDSTEVGVTEDLLHLKNLCMKLTTVDEQKSKSKGKVKASGFRLADTSVSREEDLVGVVEEIIRELSKGDGVSTFEFIGSGVVAALLNYLSCGYFSKERISEFDLPKLRKNAIKRYKSFLAISLPPVHEGSAVPMTVLIQKLQNALSSLERFPVVLSHNARSAGGSSRPSSGLSALSQPVKLRLCRAQGEKSLRDYSSNVVLIDPLASLAAVEDFLWPRVLRNEASQKPSITVGNSESGTTLSGAGASSPSSSTLMAAARRHSTRARTSINIGETANKEQTQGKGGSSSKGKGKGKAVLKYTSDERKGPQTRNASRRSAAPDKDPQPKPAGRDTSSEDDELDMSPVEIDDALVIEDDEVSDEEEEDQDDVLGDESLPACMMEKVHDVKLGEEESAGALNSADSQVNPSAGSSSRVPAVGGSDSAGRSFGSRGAMSFAAAAMAGLAASNGGAMKGAKTRHGRLIFGSTDPPRLMFSAGGKQLNRNLTIYQAIQRQLVQEDDDEEKFAGSDLTTNDGNRLWSDIYTITYQRADNQTENASPGISSSANPSKSIQASSSVSSSVDSALHQVSLLDSILQGELPCDLEKDNPTYNILALLRVLEGMNQLAPRLRVESMIDDFSEGKVTSLDLPSVPATKVPSQEFASEKLTPKLVRQLQDALALCSGSLPSWCYQLTRACPFLFPFEARRQYFYSTAFGLSRALHRLQLQQGADGHGSTNERELRVGRLQRQKVRVSRSRILESAVKVMDLYSSQKAVLEVEYFGEVGTGLGPTLEFYTLLSNELQKNKLGLWRSNALSAVRSSMEVDINEGGGKANNADGLDSLNADGLDTSPLGLFPRPWPPNVDTADGSQFSKVLEYYRLLGHVMAKALQDGRLMDLPLCNAFYKLVLGQELDLHDIHSFDVEFGKTLHELQAFVSRKQNLESLGGYAHDTAGELLFHGVQFEDLCLDFTLPGYSDYTLKLSDETVDIHNLEEYVSLVVDATVKTGIKRQMEAFRSGFNQVFDISSLQIFTPDELDYLLCGRREMWKAESLADHIKFDHGYTAKSPAVINLLEIMGEFTPDQQRAFCQFVTGAPRLPPGGLAVLNPKLTIVRKHSSSLSNTTNAGSGSLESADDDLPSVMTCANYLKLPPYSTKEIMYKKLLYAINEGQGSFDLS